MALATHPYAYRPGSPRPGSAVAARPRPRLRTLVVHQSDVVRAGIATLMESGRIGDASHAASAFEAYRISRTLRPEVVLFDFRAGEGPEVTRLLTSLWPRPRLIALLAAGSGVHPETCLQAGADGVVAVDNISTVQFLSAVAQVADGRGPVVAGVHATESAPAPTTDASVTAALTPREREMLFLIGEGLSNREIADSLVLSVKTVETHRANLSRKLNVRSRAGLMRLAMGARPADVHRPAEVRPQRDLWPAADLRTARDLPPARDLRPAAAR